MNENENNQNTAPQPTDPPQPHMQQSIEVTESIDAPVFPPAPNSQPQDRKPSKWRYLFIVLGAIQALGVAVFFFIMFLAIEQAKSGVSGTEFIGLLLFATLVPAVGVVALVNLIGLPIYIGRFKPRGKGLIFSILSLFISAVLFLYGAYSVYELRVSLPRQSTAFSEQSRKNAAQREEKFAAENAQPEISKEEAITLLQSCKLSGFYYTQETVTEHGTSPAASATGIVLTKVNGEPSRISIADRLVSELVPIARKAQNTCDGPQFWHDGSYEHYENGKWYFEGEVVNSAQ